MWLCDSCVISAFSCVCAISAISCVCVISAMDDGKCSPVWCESQYDGEVTSCGSRTEDHRLDSWQLACFFPQEYQHVHHLWFKKRSFTLLLLENLPLFPQYKRPFCCAQLPTPADAATINQALHFKHHAVQMCRAVSLCFQFRLPFDVSHIQQKWQRLWVEQRGGRASATAHKI